MRIRYCLIYFSPYFDAEVHARIVALLDSIYRRHGIPWREVVIAHYSRYGRVPGASEEEIYERYLRPSCRVIPKCLLALKGMGVDVYVENVSRKFRTRSGNYAVAGSVVLTCEDRVVCALNYKGEILSFLSRLEAEGVELLDNLMDSIGGAGKYEGTPLSERVVLRKYAEMLARRGYEVYVNVKHNIYAGEEPEYMFQPDADLIAVKGTTLIGLEVKGGNKEGPSLDKVYTGLGEAIFYLVNPIMFLYRNREIQGGVLDKVYLALPTLPSRINKNTLLEIFRKVRIVGLMTVDEGTIIEPMQNPFLNPLKKEALLRNKHVLQRYLAYIPR